MVLSLALLACSTPAPGDPRPDGGADSAPAPDSGGGDSAETGADSADSGDPFCEGAPTLAYSNFGEGFLLENCQGCHASTAPERHGAPEEVTFDTVEQVWVWAERILAVSTGDSPSMPPRGGISEDDRTRLEWWLRCGTPGT